MIGALITLMLIAVGLLHFMPVLSERRAQQAHLHQLMAEVEQERQGLALNKHFEDLLKLDPEFAALIARDRLDLMHPGEKIYRFYPMRTEQAQQRR